MNILVEIAHPAHVHFFRFAIGQLERQGHTVHVVTRNKEITNALLDCYHQPYTCLSVPAKSKPGLLFELLARWIKVIAFIKKNKIDVAVSISGISTSLPAWLCRIPNATFTDTEDAHLSNKIAFPFTDVIWTPDFFLQDLGEKHRRYKGLHELAYLSRYDDVAGSEVRHKLNLPEKYCIVRLVAHDAVHDWSIQGVRDEQLNLLIRELGKLGQVYITSQNPLPDKLKPFALKIPIDQVHAVLAGASVFVGESPTMAVEAGILGTPSFLISQRVQGLGNMVRLEKEWHILRNFSSWDDYFAFMKETPFDDAVRTTWQTNAKKFTHAMDDVNEIIIGTILGK